ADPCGLLKFSSRLGRLTLGLKTALWLLGNVVCRSTGAAPAPGVLGNLHARNARRLGQADFLIAQVAAGVLAPQVAGCPGTGAGVAVADRQPAALGATPLDGPRVLAQLQQQRLGLLQPDFAKGVAAHVADGVLPPVSIRVYIADVVDIGDAAARGIAPPGAQHLLQALGVLRQVFRDPLQQQDGVGVV